MATYGGHISLEEIERRRGTTGGGGTPGVPYGDVASAINVFQTGEAAKPFHANLPGYGGMIDQRSDIIQSQLAGEVPQDVVTQLIQSAAERGIAGGSPGSPNANAAYLRALGLTSIDQQQRGQEGLSTAIADTPVPELFNVGGLYGAMELGNQELNAFEKTIRREPTVYEKKPPPLLNTSAFYGSTGLTAAGTLPRRWYT